MIFHETILGNDGLYVYYIRVPHYLYMHYSILMSFEHIKREATLRQQLSKAQAESFFTFSTAQ